MIINYIKKNLFVILLILSIFFISIFIRIYKIESLPLNIIYDEADNLQTFLLAKYNHSPKIWELKWDGAPVFSIFIMGFFWDLFNESILGLRFASILFSSITIAISFYIFYFVSQKKILSFLFSFSLACNQWFLNFSRNAWENVNNALSLNILLLGFIFFFCKSRKKLGFFLMLFSSVLSFYFYQPGKIFFLPVLIVLLFYAINGGNFFKKINFLLLFIVIFLLSCLPLLIAIKNNKLLAFSRINNVSIFNNNNGKDLRIEISKNFTSNFYGFVLFDKRAFDIGQNSVYLPLSHPPIDNFIIPLFWIGTIYSIFKYPYFVLTYLLLIFPVQILSINTPNGARGVHILPLVYLFAVIGGNFILKLFKKYYIIPYFILAFLLVFFSINNLINYFDWTNNNSTLLLREPAVYNKEYEIWLVNQKYYINIINKWGFNVGQWKEIRNNQIIIK